jgi:predicted metal-dependent hydrolase
MATLTAEARLAEARELIEIAKKELQEAEIQVMRKDRQLMNARSNLRSVEAEILAEPSSFKQITDAIQVIQLYAIRNGISLGSTVDALTEKLAAGS